MKSKKIYTANKAIELAKFNIDTDPHLANYILRDLEILKEAKLDDLSWTLHNEGCCKNDVLGLIEDIENYLNEEKNENNKCQN